MNWRGHKPRAAFQGGRGGSTGIGPACLHRPTLDPMCSRVGEILQDHTTPHMYSEVLPHPTGAHMSHTVGNNLHVLHLRTCESLLHM